MIWHCLTHKLFVGLAAIRGRGVWDGSEARRGRCDRPLAFPDCEVVVGEFLRSGE